MVLNSAFQQFIQSINTCSKVLCCCSTLYTLLFVSCVHKVAWRRLRTVAVRIHIVNGIYDTKTISFYMFWILQIEDASRITMINSLKIKVHSKLITRTNLRDCQVHVAYIVVS